MNDTPITPDDVMPLNEFIEKNKKLFPAGEASGKSLVRNRKDNGLNKAGAIVKRFNRMFVVVPNFMAWYAGQ